MKVAFARLLTVAMVGATVAVLAPMSPASATAFGCTGFSGHASQNQLCQNVSGADLYVDFVYAEVVEANFDGPSNVCQTQFRLYHAPLYADGYVFTYGSYNPSCNAFGYASQKFTPATYHANNSQICTTFRDSFSGSAFYAQGVCHTIQGVLPPAVRNLIYELS